MSDNVIIVGAGASVDAGVPVLRNFVDTMWEIAIRGRIGDKVLEDSDKEIFKRAMAVRDDLNEYHGRAAFDDRNIEDILSLLTFNQMAGGRGTRTDIPSITKAIARTIELTCKVRHSGSLNSVQQEGSDIYRRFWRGFVRHVDSLKRQLPAIISFNYDLVFERSFLQSFVGMDYSPFDESKPFPFDRVSIDYHYDQLDDHQYSRKFVSFRGASMVPKQGVRLVREIPASDRRALSIPILKLHGSVNFPQPASRKRESSASKAIDPDFTDLPRALDDPYILPPIFNKTSSGPTVMWKEALNQLREAKNVTIVGYSLPRTDIYMQYFLKSALGPNLNLNKITVFNPLLYNEGRQEMEDRYASCFAPQLRNRIVFKPHHERYEGQPGTFEHFVDLLESDPAKLFF